MKIHNLLLEIKETLIGVFVEVDHWFDKPDYVRDYRPSDNGWTINEILEHISLTNYLSVEID